MDENKLKKKGWSEQEITHAKSIFAKAKEHEHPEVQFGKHVRLWTLIIISLTSTIGLCVAIFPIALIMPTWFNYGFFAVLGLCIGLLITASLHSLDIHHSHHHHAMSVFTIMLVVTITIVIALLEQRYGGIMNPLLLAMIYTIGSIIPYQLHKRLHGYS